MRHKPLSRTLSLNFSEPQFCCLQNGSDNTPVMVFLCSFNKFMVMNFPCRVLGTSGSCCSRTMTMTKPPDIRTLSYELGAGMATESGGKSPHICALTTR